MSTRNLPPGAGLLLAAFGAILLHTPAPATAQTFRGEIHGSIVDPSGALVSGAGVKAERTETSQAYATTSTSAGEFTLQDLPLGVYTVTVNASGFEPLTVSQLTVQAGSVYNLSLHLVLASVSAQVEVVAPALSLDSTNSVQSEVLTTTAVQTIPLNGRDFTQLLTVTPGYAGYGVGFMSAINGAQATQINWQIEGADNNDA
jgi:hypothetical protein